MSDPFVSRISIPADVPAEDHSPSKEPTIMAIHPIEAEPPLEAWAEVNGMPYTAKHFDINIWNEHAERSVKAVEGYIMDEIRQKGLEPTVASYHEIMGNIMSFLQLSPNTANNVRFEKVSDYVKLFSKYNKIEQQKKKLLAQANELRGIEYG